MCKNTTENAYIKGGSLGAFSFEDSLKGIQLTSSLLTLPFEVSNLAKSISEIHTKMDSILIYLKEASSEKGNFDGYISASAARNYLGMSQNTFDKYSYDSKIKLKGCKLDGKNWYKKSDLDLFMLTYDLKSRGIA